MKQVHPEDVQEALAKAMKSEALLYITGRVAAPDSGLPTEIAPPPFPQMHPATPQKKRVASPGEFHGAC